MSAPTQSGLSTQIREVAERAGCSLALHVRSLDGDDAEVDIGADTPSLAASTYKVAVLLELACQAAEGRLDLTGRLRVTPAQHSAGISGISTMLDEIEISIRDLALLMIQVSDNTATDVLQRLVGTENIAHRLRNLGIKHTEIRTDCAGLIGRAVDDLGGDPHLLSPEELASVVPRSIESGFRTGNTTTPRDMTRLLQAIWLNQAGPAEACAEVRRIMSLQFAPHRISTSYRDGPAIAGKTGTFYGGIRNEVGVLEFGPEDRYAVAVYLRQRHYDLRDGTADAAIGTVTRMAVDHLRTRQPAHAAQDER
ncbi:serine hydrolase [Phytoactinopolyspora alkaliphila]|uniref:Serine hydrolase n=1 Tax=Phytoactinopolyspora alkaliphila TaxID=1783498 RepID=A0A6N9YMS4_9ACTN|nr:serine hydrolase [Phytoactinopolyspora alkaliphila]NED96283.1 serine hydrolase [Phytoactinopolyspora alkaliphila]